MPLAVLDSLKRIVRSVFRRSDFRFNLFYILLPIALLIVTGSLWYSNLLVKKLAVKEELLVNFWASVYEFIATTEPENLESSFLINNIILKQPKIIDVPAIVVDENGKPNMHNLQLPEGLTRTQQEQYLLAQLEEMKASGFKPIKFSYLPGTYHYVYYRETPELIQLRYYPYITFTLLILFVLVVFANFYVAQRSEQNKIWVGLARETAHQLGTPISGLIAWVELLKLKVANEDDQMVVDELTKDINHLEVIANRFSKIGSEPELIPYDVAEILDRSLKYVRTRAGRTKPIITTFKNELPQGYVHPISPLLLEWVVENLVKNAMDALSGKSDGAITLTAQLKGTELVIDVEDNGKGMSRSDAQKVFKPGFTTKKRGWGLGLSLSKRIIEEFHEGKIFVKHSELEHGTTFRIILPLRKRLTKKYLQ